MYTQQWPIKGHFIHKGFLVFVAYCQVSDDLKKTKSLKETPVFTFMSMFFYTFIPSQSELMVYCKFCHSCVSPAYYTFECVRRCECLLICAFVLAGSKWSPAEVVSDV